MTAVAASVFMPACMSEAEYALWRADEGTTTERVASAGLIPCADCLPSFAAEMWAEGRCNGIPRGREEEDGTMEPTPIESMPERTVGRRPKRDLSVGVTAPCDRCVHLRVCGIREPLVDLVLRAEMPALSTALDVTVQAVVKCEEFRPGRTAAQVAAQQATVKLAQAAAKAKRAATS